MSGKKPSIPNWAKKTVPIDTEIRWDFLFVSVTRFSYLLQERFGAELLNDMQYLYDSVVITCYNI